MRTGGGLDQAGDGEKWTGSGTWGWVGHDAAGLVRARNVSGITLRFPGEGGTFC